MGLMQEGLRKSGEIRNALTPVNLNRLEIKTNSLPIAETGLEVRFRELPQMLFAESKKVEETEEPQLQETGKNGFEPFINGVENDENNLFVNLYGGNFSQKMQLNRKRVERVLKIAHLDGQVFLTTLSPNRQRSIEANPDGSVSAKRFLFFGEKTEEDGKDNPLSRVVAVPQGWRIEINDQKLTEELTEKKLSGKELQRTFINRFNSQLKGALKECVWREKFSSEKDQYFKSKVSTSLFPILLYTTIEVTALATHADPSSIFLRIGSVIGSYGIINWIFNFLIEPEMGRNIDHPLEYLMPNLELDKVLRSFLSLKARTLVRETKPEVKQ